MEDDDDGDGDDGDGEMMMEQVEPDTYGIDASLMFATISSYIPYRVPRVLLDS